MDVYRMFRRNVRVIEIFDLYYSNNVCVCLYIYIYIHTYIYWKQTLSLFLLIAVQDKILEEENRELNFLWVRNILHTPTLLMQGYFQTALLIPWKVPNVISFPF